ncbi:hypothetical protein DIPPA_17118 [Diplonema papillatum]|nr:hypothetical protein DIPPA_17118 [Diplonema papillatum]
MLRQLAAVALLSGGLAGASDEPAGPNGGFHEAGPAQAEPLPLVGELAPAVGTEPQASGVPPPQPSSPTGVEGRDGDIGSERVHQQHPPQPPPGTAQGPVGSTASAGTAPDGSVPAGTAQVGPVGSTSVGTAPEGTVPIGTAPAGTSPLGASPAVVSAGTAPESAASMGTAPLGTAPADAPARTDPIVGAPIVGAPEGTVPTGAAPAGSAGIQPPPLQPPPPPADGEQQLPANTPKTPPPAFSVHGTHAPHQNLLVYILLIPMTLFVAGVGLQIWAPHWLAAGGPAASAILIFVRPCLPSTAPPRGTPYHKTYTWLVGSEEPLRGAEDGARSSMFSARGAGTKAKARIKDWWTGGRLGNAFAVSGRDGGAGRTAGFKWEPVDIEAAQAAARAERKQKKERPKKAHPSEASRAPGPGAEGHVSPTQQRAAAGIMLTAKEVQALLAQEADNEELLRVRVDREEGEDRWLLARQLAVDGKRVQDKVIRKLVFGLCKDEGEARAGVDSNYHSEFAEVQSSAARSRWHAKAAEARRAVCTAEELGRGALAAAEGAAVSDLASLRRAAHAWIATRPEREAIFRAQAMGRMDVEDDESGQRTYASEAFDQRTLFCVESAERKAVASAHSAGRQSLLQDLTTARLAGLETDEATARSQLASEASTAFNTTVYLPAQRSSLQVLESEGRVSCGREEKRARRTAWARREASLAEVNVRMGLQVLEGLSVKTMDGVTRDENDAFFDLTREAAASATFAEEAAQRRAWATEEDAAFSALTARHVGELSGILENEKMAAEEARRLQRAACDGEESSGRAHVAALEAEAWAVLQQGSAASVATAVTSERERLEKLRGLIDALARTEASTRQDAEQQEETDRQPFAAAFQQQSDAASALEARRVSREAGERAAVEAAEAAERQLATRAERVHWDALADELRTGQQLAELQDAVAAIAALEEAGRGGVVADEEMERDAAQTSEHGRRMAINEDIIRGVKKSTEVSTDVVRMKVVADEALVRESSALRSRKVGMVTKGDIVHVVERRGVRCKLHEHNGWVSVQGQMGNRILQEVPLEPGEVIVLPERKATPPPNNSRDAQDVFSQVTAFGSQLNKGWGAFGGFLGSSTAAKTPPKSKTLSGSKSDGEPPSASPELSPPPPPMPDVEVPSPSVKTPDTSLDSSSPAKAKEGKAD